MSFIQNLYPEAAMITYHQVCRLLVSMMYKKGNLLPNEDSTYEDAQHQHDGAEGNDR